MTIVRQRLGGPSIDSVVSLADTLQIAPGCSVASSLDSPHEQISPGQWSYLQLVAVARGANPRAALTLELSEVPRELYFFGANARLRGAVLLSRCVDNLLTETVQSRIEDGPSYCDGVVSITVVASQCAAELGLAQVGPLAEQQRVSLCREGVAIGAMPVWAGSGASTDQVRVTLGTVDTNTAGTPLQRALRAQQSALHSPRWFALTHQRGAWVFEPTAALGALGPVLSELRVASAAQELMVAIDDRVVGVATFTDQGRFLRLQDAIWTEYLQHKFGSIGRVLSPNLREATTAVERVKLCLSAQYNRPGPTLARERRRTAIAPTDLCVPLRLAQQNVIRTQASLAHTMVTITQHQQRMTVRAPVMTSVERTVRDGLDTFGLQGSGRMRTILSIGDHIDVSETPGDLYLCGETGVCRPLSSQGQTLTVAGLIELRRAPSQQIAETVQSATLARWVVIDPWRDWVMHGLLAHPSTSQGPVWEQLRHDDDETFAFERRVSGLDSRIALTEGAAALSRHLAPDNTISLTEELAVQTGDQPNHLGFRSQNALAVVFARTPHCPLVSGERVDPNALLPATEFFAFLQLQDGSGWCLASAKFRVRYRRTLAQASTLALGYLAEPHIAWFSPWNQWGAVGMILPALYSRVSLGPWLATELSVGVVSGVNLSPTAISVTGPVLTAHVRAGVLSVGAALLIPQVLGVNAPRVTLEPFVSIDLGAAYELVGGR